MQHERSYISHTLFFFILFRSFIHLAVSSDSSDPSHDSLVACDGEVASFSWPCDLHYDLVKQMTLTFSGLNAQDRLVATILTNGSVIVAAEYSNRVRARGTSGIHVDSVGILDSGMYVTKGEFDNGTVVERHFTLSIHVPPLLTENGLTVTAHNMSQGCQRVACGQVLFPGYPPVSFAWNTPEGSQTQDSSEGLSVLHGCPMSPGNYTCQLVSPALNCGRYRAVSASVSVRELHQNLAEAAEAAAARSAAKEREEQILIIVVPILAVVLPLAILGLWVLSHLLSDCRISHDKMDDEAPIEDSDQELCVQSSEVFSAVTAVGLSAAMPLSPSRQGSMNPGSPTSETVPLTSAAGDQDDEDEEEDTEEGLEAAQQSDDDADFVTVMADNESFRLNFADGGDETRL